MSKQRKEDRAAAWQDILSAVENAMKRARPGVDEPRTWKREDLYDRWKRPTREQT